MKQSLFGHLAFSFSKSPENLATEALSFILNRSVVANNAFLRFLSQTGVALPETLKFDTQAGEAESGIPDLRGKDANGKEVFLGEAKFWAGLTDNQPVAYLTRLQKSSGSILLFIAPEKRSTLLWAELLRRGKDANLNLHQEESSLIQTALFDNNFVLAITSWRMILNSLRSSVEADGDAETLSDIVQLQGLCDKMDEQAFLPLRSEELTSNIGKRIVQFYGLIDDVVQNLETKKIVSTDGLSTTRTSKKYGKYFSVKRYGCLLLFDPILWNKYRETPLWLIIKDGTDPNNWVFSFEAKEKLFKLEIEKPSRLFQNRKEDELLVPLFLPIGVEKDAVIQSLVSQIREISGYLA